MNGQFFNLQSTESQQLYEDLLTITGSLSRLFAESENPFLYYRAAENIFCKAFDAENLSRSDVSADASKNGLGIGLKTFLYNNGRTFQKVAEFNRELQEFKDLEGLDLIIKISEMRNERIRMTKRAFGLNEMIYHLVTRSKNQMQLFEEPMTEIDLDSIRIDKSNSNKNTIKFRDRYNEYSFSLSKSTLLKRFITIEEQSLRKFEVHIYEDPFDFLLRSKKELVEETNTIVPEELDYVILPLYSPSTGEVEEKSGLNAWNAAPRKKGGPPRHYNEVYIIVPTWIHEEKPDFFNFHKGMNPKDLPPFQVKLPNKKKITIKLAQQGGKALSSNPLTALGEWILRDVLNIPPRTLVTRSMLNIIGIDSVKLSKVSETEFLLDFMETGSYEEFEQRFLETNN
ncbi:NgoFVII family restriction endonuclease [Caldifermentibacillus hisashii]|uniref:restriction endonuclease n=1 Tax=Caldifermentibacillus hisashii TaxID=996558 RepID=UPI002E2429F2|nr:NgoFVII family restriction endonuclease [Caldifermentibacillus hisashii]